MLCLDKKTNVFLSERMSLVFFETLLLIVTVSVNVINC